MKKVMVNGIAQRDTAAKWYSKFHFSDYATLMHLPFSGIVLAFVIIGAAMSKNLYVGRLILALVGIFFVHQCSHFLDEIKGRPWGTKISDRTLYILGFLFMAIGTIIGIFLLLTVSIYLIVFTAPGIFIPITYSLELWSARFHRPLAFGISCALACLGSFFLQSLTVTLSSVFMCVAIGIQGVYIVILYEGTKNSRTRNLCWSALKGIVMMWIFIAMSMLALKFT